MSELISPQALHAQQAAPQPPMVIDVREPDEYAAGHISGAANIPSDQVPERLAEIPRNRLVVTY
jgi:rhodanese-related sulfurtransferase